MSHAVGSAKDHKKYKALNKSGRHQIRTLSGHFYDQMKS
jgi:hypothetical protein